MVFIDFALAPRREKLFCLAAAAALALCVGAAWYFAVPFAPQPASQSAMTLAQAARVDLNTAGVEALCTLPGVGESRARAIIAYRAEHGRFASVSEAAKVPGLTRAIVEQWEPLAYVGRAYPAKSEE